MADREGTGIATRRVRTADDVSRIRVLRLIARMNVGGPALQVTGLVEGLDPERFEHRVLTGYVEPGEADYVELRAPELFVERIEALGRSIRVGGDARAFAAILGEIRRFKPDIVHTHTAKAGVLGRVAARIAGVPHTVHTFHGHLLRGYFSDAGTAAVTRVERMLARRTDRLLAVGERVRDELLTARIGRPEQYRVVPPGVRLPSAPSREDARRRLRLKPDAPVVCFVARLTAVKRPDRLLEVAARVRAAVPDAVFLVAGEGPELEGMRSDAARLGDSLRFLGWRSDVETIYAASDVVALTSDNEGMPLSLIEAALVGCPAVATDVGSVREVVLDGRTGLLTSVASEAVAVDVLRLLGDADLRRRLGAAARDHAEARFGVRRLVSDTEAIYAELLEGTV